MYYVYVLKSKTHRTRYVGSTQNVEARLKMHNEGNVRYTSGRRPWELVYVEEFPTQLESLQREKSLKMGRGRAELDGILSERKE